MKAAIGPGSANGSFVPHSRPWSSSQRRSAVGDKAVVRVLAQRFKNLIAQQSVYIPGLEVGALEFDKDQRYFMLAEVLPFGRCSDHQNSEGDARETGKRQIRNT